MYALSQTKNPDVKRLHFNFCLEHIQQEVEKRTSYLGKFRRTEEAAHLQDLLTMTKDEHNLFVSLSQSAMNDVWEELRKGAMHLRGLDYTFTDGTEYKTIKLNPTITATTSIVDSSHDGKSVNVSIKTNYESDGYDNSTYGACMDVEVTVDTMFYLLNDIDSQVVRERTVKCHIPYKFVSMSMGKFSTNYTIDIPLDPISDFTSEERITNVKSVKLLGMQSYNRDETELFLGDYALIDGKAYYIKNNTNINEFDINADAVEVNKLEITDGVHFYMNIPSSVNPNLIKPLDDAIAEALVLKIMHSWFLFSYPQEAEVYAVLSANALAQVYKRCNVFNVVHSKVPRIF